MIKEREPCRSEARTIIVVDDDNDNREMFELVITSETPYQPVMIESGQETLQRIEEIKALKPVLFLLDYQLPPMTAFDLYDRLHEIEEFKDVPAIIVTAETVHHIEDAIKQRHLTFLAKPFELDDLLVAMKQIIG